MRSFSAARYSCDLGFECIGCTLSFALATLYNDLYLLYLLLHQRVVAMNLRRTVKTLLHHSLLHTTFGEIYSGRPSSGVGADAGRIEHTYAPP